MGIRRLSVVDADDESGAAEQDGSRHVAPEELLVRTARGDSDAFSALYDLFSSRVYGIAVRVVRDPDQAQEVAQEAFVEVWQRASRFSSTRGSASSWIMTIAHSRAVDRVRSAQAATDRETRVGRASIEREVDSVSEAVETSMEQAAVRRCLESLTQLQQQSVVLAYYSGYTYPQVADLLHAALPTVKTRIRDGLIRLRDCLGVSR